MGLSTVIVIRCPSWFRKNWRNGNEFLFLDGKDDVAELVSLFKERDSSPENSVHFLFPNDVDSGPPSTNHIVVDVSGFSAGFGAFEKGCAKAQWAQAAVGCRYAARNTMHLMIVCSASYREPFPRQAKRNALATIWSASHPAWSGVGRKPHAVEDLGFDHFHTQSRGHDLDRE
jgi:hypothetical protein